jgi:exodeoxyribonuclease V alpha subunit
MLEEQPSVTLEHVYRQEEGNDILDAATRIRTGVMPTKGSDFKYTLTEKPLKTLEDLVMWGEDNGVSFRDIKNQIIVPINKTWVGVLKLNPMLQGLLNPSPEQTVDLPREAWLKEFPVRAGIGDKVVCTENTYDLRSWQERYTEWEDGGTPVLASYLPPPETKVMLNGETGVITHITDDGSLEIDFGDRTVEVSSTMYEYWAKKDTVIEVDPRKKISLAYALTTHKCQGSEFDTVIYLMNKSMTWGQGRENFYTAVTRAKRKVHVVTDSQSLRTSVMRKVGAMQKQFGANKAKTAVKR